LADAVMLLVVVIWAGNNVLTKSVLDVEVSPLAYVLVRLTIVSALLFAILLARRQRVAIAR
jgi:drug/metabolite transporter (DMT)-like permease